uniref:Reticulocalbin-3 n=1 Tax=Suricata suricatta TaxID=37032 RepID=A0A673UKB1_SURSU
MEKAERNVWREAKLDCLGLMMWRPSLLLLLLLLRRGTQGKPSPDAGPHGQGRVHQAAPLSEAPHDDAHGNFQYDHEAFLGREVAKEFDQLSPEESRARLGRIVDRMDRAGDGDGWVSLAELRAWIAHTQQRHIRDSVSAAWNTYDTNRDGRVGWEELRNATYGHYEPGEEFHDVEDAETYKKMLARDERRFRVADQDGDSMATREELTAFLHPEEFPHMRDIVIAETLEDLDKNKDGYVQVEEYIGISTPNVVLELMTLRSGVSRTLCLRPASCPSVLVLKVHPPGGRYHPSSIPWLHDISLCEYAVFCVCIQHLKDLGCFHFPCKVTSAARIVHVEVFAQTNVQSSWEYT